MAVAGNIVALVLFFAASCLSLFSFPSSAAATATWTATANPAIQNIAFASQSATFSSVNIGSASSDRIVVVTVGQDQGDLGAATSVTIGGISATKAAEETHDTSSLWYLNVTSGTAADIVVTYPSTLAHVGITVGTFKRSGCNTKRDKFYSE